MDKANNWRAYDFAIDYLIDRRAHREEEGQLPETARAACELSAEYVKALPDDGRAYCARVKALRFMEARGVAHRTYEAPGELGRIRHEDSWKEILNKLTFAQDPDNRLPVAACCMQYADVLLERGEYEKARRAAIQGIRDAAQAQPGVRTGYLVYVCALCTDALLLDDFMGRNREDGSPVEAPSEELKERAKRLIEDYQIAKRMLNGVSYANEIDNRMNAIAALFDVAAPSYLEAPNSAEIEQQLRELLGQGN